MDQILSMARLGDINQAMINAVRSGNVGMIDRLRAQGADNIDAALSVALASGQSSAAARLRALGAKDGWKEGDDCLSYF